MASKIPLQWLPVLLSGWLSGSFVITYIMAVSYHHTYPIWPTISNTGALAPESCYFSLLISFATVLNTLTIYIRQCQLLEYTRCRPKTGPRNVVIYISSIIGFIACVGLFIDANFQETSDLPVHLFGAQAAIYFSTIYYIFQTVFSFFMAPEMNSRIMSFIRAGINCLNVGFIVASFLVHKVGAEYFKGKTIDEYLNWSPDDAGWPYKVATSALEWAVILCFILYSLTFYPDFKRIEMELPVTKPVPADTPILLSYSDLRESFRYPEHRKRPKREANCRQT